MEKRRWGNMNSDCLVNIFGRLDLESRLLGVPFVCKHWHRALANPMCWQNLVFPLDVPGSRLADALEDGNDINISELIKLVVGRSQGCATTLVLPACITEHDLIYVSDECSALQILALDYFYDLRHDTIQELMVKWKSLEVLKLSNCNFGSLVQIIDKIVLHCKNFSALWVVHGKIDNEVASAIVSKLATIKGLNLSNCRLAKVDLMLILRGCKELEMLNIRNCIGFEEDDEEILKLASGINDFKCAGSKTIYNPRSFLDSVNSAIDEGTFYRYYKN